MISSAWIAALFGVFCLILNVSDGHSFPPPLSFEEERQYFRLARAGDKKAREELILHNLRLVAHIVKKYCSPKDSQEDLISIGTVGLIKAIDTFDESNGTRFATYAGKCLQNEILMYFRSQKKLSGERSMNEAIDVDKDGNPLTYEDVLFTEDTIAEDVFLKNGASKALRFIYNCLDDREREIVLRRYGLGGNAPETQKEIAKNLGISRSYVSRIEKAALEKVHEYLDLAGI